VLSSPTENSVTDLFGEFLRSRGLNATTQRGCLFPNGRRGTVDFWVQNEEVFVGEAEWEETKWRGLAQAHDYLQTPEAQGTFLITYPEDLKKEIEQARLGKISPEQILSKYKYSVAFLRRDKPTDIRSSLSLEDVSLWLENNIHKREVPKQDIEEVIRILQQSVNVLTKELEVVSKDVGIFRTIIGGELSGEEMKRAARYASGYLLLNQMVFYRILSSYNPEKFPIINPDSLQSPQELNSYFDKVLDQNYAPIFSFGVASEFSHKSLGLLREVIKAIYGLSPESITHVVLGTVFHSLIPISVRRPIAAYYTKNEAAKLLADLSIKDSNAKIIDPACGSGTLLSFSYKRKKELLETQRKFEESDHKRFVEKEITGIDIMPFAAHLSTIQLAMEAPIYETNEVRIGIYDSTRLKVGSVIPPLSYVLPEARKQRAITEFVDGIKRRDKKIEVGSIAMNAKPGKEIRIEEADVVIMNPPFTRQESILSFGETYKERLRDRFPSRNEVIDERMSYCSYFILLADELIGKGGKIAAVLPASILRKDTDKKLRKTLLDEYWIQYILIRQDAMNFSEETVLHEILLIAEKGKKGPTSFVLLKELDGSLAPTIDHLSKISKEGEIVQDAKFELRKISQDALDSRNLFKNIALANYELIKFWDSICTNPKLIEVSKTKTVLTEGARSRKGGSFPEMSLINPQTPDLSNRDIWIIEALSENSIIAKNRSSEDLITIPKRCVLPSLRRITGQTKIDVSDYEEFVVHRKFPNYENFLALGEVTTRGISNKWSAYLKERKSNFAIRERFMIGSPGTNLFAYYSNPPRVFPNMMICLRDLSDEEAKIWSLWFNSAINFVQILIERVPTGWSKVRQYVLEELKVISVDKLSIDEKKQLLSIFESVRHEDFPCVWVQLARNLKSDRIPKSKLEKYLQHFEGIQDQFGKGFEPRLKIDRAIMRVLGIDEKAQQDLLEKIYLYLIDETMVLDKIIEGEND
jgi:hypothetical protein